MKFKRCPECSAWIEDYKVGVACDVCFHNGRKKGTGERIYTTDDMEITGDEK